MLGELGFNLARTHGSHLIFKHPDGRITVIPRHGNQEIGRGILRSIAVDLRVSPEALGRMIDEA